MAEEEKAAAPLQNADTKSQAYVGPLNDDDNDNKKEDPEHEMRAQYFAVTAERRTRFRAIMNKMDQLNFQLSKSNIFQFTINDNQTFNIETRVTYSKPFKKEPTVWYLETLMPGSPSTFLQYWCGSEYRLKWDTQISTHKRIILHEDKDSSLSVLNTQTRPAVGGLISPRQFTDCIHAMAIDNGGLELASQSVEDEEFPPKKGFVNAWNYLYGQRITKVPEKEVNAKYGIPTLKVNEERLEWCKCQYMMQTDIKGWLPTNIVELGISGGISSTFEMCREYMLQHVFGFNVKVTKSS